MNETPRLMPRAPVPPLTVPTTDGPFDLADARPENFTLVVFYRGYHCPVCAKQLRELEGLVPEFERRGVQVIAVSTDTEDRARKAKEGWKLERVPVAYGLSVQDAARWGLYVSSGRGKTSIGIEEPDRFTEPGVFLVRPDGTLYYGAWQTMPFARPHFDELLSAVDAALNRNYPARGEVAVQPPV